MAEESDVFFNEAYDSDNGDNDRLEQYEVMKDNDQDLEIVRLRQENRILRQMIENLEKETETLAGRLVHHQVNSARMEEVIESLKREIIQLKEERNNDSDKHEFGQIKDYIQISNLQRKIQDGQKDKLEERLEQAESKEKELIHQIKELELRLANAEAKSKENEIMVKIKDSEYSQTIAEMRRKIAEIEIELLQMKVTGKLQNISNVVGDVVDDVSDDEEGERLLKISSKIKNGNCDSMNDSISKLTLDSTFEEDECCECKNMSKRKTSHKNKNTKETLKVCPNKSDCNIGNDVTVNSEVLYNSKENNGLSKAKDGCQETTKTVENNNNLMDKDKGNNEIKSAVQSCNLK